MARIETDPNYTTPTFSRATAATDPFKKEDVQLVAAALSTHDHTSGKGLALAAGSIPAGTITSAMIADGTITASDLAAGAATALVGSYQNIPSFSTTTVGSWIDTPITVTFTATGAQVMLWADICLLHSASGGAAYVGIAKDGTIISSTLAVYQNTGANINLSLAMNILDTPTATSHTYRVQVYNTNAGTLSCSGVALGILNAWELRR